MANSSDLKTITIKVPIESWAQMQRLVLEEKIKGNTQTSSLSQLIRTALNKQYGIEFDVSEWGYGSRQ